MKVKCDKDLFNSAGILIFSESKVYRGEFVWLLENFVTINELGDVHILEKLSEHFNEIK